jgi:hypothetical protein
MEKIAYKGWNDCIRLANRTLEMILTANVGPRIIRLGLIGQPNELYEDEAWIGKSGDSEFHTYGGHRLWRAPEDPILTYVPDNRPVTVEPTPDGVHLLPPPEKSTGIQKEWFVWLDPQQTHARIRHRLSNGGTSPIRLAPWALTVMASEGVAVLPLPPRGSHPDNLLPTSRLAMWAYTDMTDPRWVWGQKYILLRQDPQKSPPQKIGASVPDGWAAYCRHGHLFIKLFTFQPDQEYPDLGSSAALFTNGDILEVETLGPLALLSPGQSVDHTEDWFLFDGVAAPADDRDVDRLIIPKLDVARQITGRAG